MVKILRLETATNRPEEKNKVVLQGKEVALKLDTDRVRLKKSSLEKVFIKGVRKVGDRIGGPRKAEEKEGR